MYMSCHWLICVCLFTTSSSCHQLSLDWGGGSGHKSLSLRTCGCHCMVQQYFHVATTINDIKCVITIGLQTVTRPFLRTTYQNTSPHPLIQVGQCRKAGRQGSNQYYFQIFVNCQENSCDAWNIVHSLKRNVKWQMQAMSILTWIWSQLMRPNPSSPTASHSRSHRQCPDVGWRQIMSKRELIKLNLLTILRTFLLKIGYLGNVVAARMFS